MTALYPEKRCLAYVRPPPALRRSLTGYDASVRIISLRPACVVVALSRRDTEALLDLLVEGQAEWEDGIAKGWIERGEASYWDDGTGERMSRRLGEAFKSFGLTDRPAP